MQELSTQEPETLNQVAPESVEIINREHEALLGDCKDSQQKAASARDRAVLIGQELLKVKAAVGHGNFMAWVETNCAFKRQTANNYMNFANSHRDGNLPDDLSLRQAYKALGIIPASPREGGNTFRGGGIPSVYDPLNALTKFLGAVDNSGTPQLWETDEYERSAVQRQYKPQLEVLILRLFGVKVELPAQEG